MLTKPSAELIWQRPNRATTKPNAEPNNEPGNDQHPDLNVQILIFVNFAGENSIFLGFKIKNEKN